MIKKSETGSGNWVTAAQGNSYTVTAEDVGWYFRANSYAHDQADPPANVNNLSNVVGPIEQPSDPLTASKPTLTGDPCVGYTLSCSEPVPAGGVAPYTFSYFWVDMTRDQRMAPTTTVTEYDLGKQMKCLVTVTDAAGQSVQVETDSTIAAFRPTLGDYQAYVDDVLVDGPSVGLAPSQICGCMVQEGDPVAFPPKDLGFKWEIRTGTGRLSGDNGGPFIGYVAPDTAPAGALVDCTIFSSDANDEQVTEIEFLIAE